MTVGRGLEVEDAIVRGWYELLCLGRDLGRVVVDKEDQADANLLKSRVVYLIPLPRRVFATRYDVIFPTLWSRTIHFNYTLKLSSRPPIMSTLPQVSYFSQ